MYRFLGASLISYLLSSGFKESFNQFNADYMRHKFYNEGKRSKYKSPFITLMLTGLFGGYGMLYVSPRIGLPFAVLDMFLLPVFLFAVILRPLEIALALLAVFSHNEVLNELEIEFNLYEEVENAEKQPFNHKSVPRINGRKYRRNPYVS